MDSLLIALAVVWGGSLALIGGSVIGARLSPRFRQWSIGIPTDPHAPR